MSEQDRVRWTASMMHNDPDIYAIFKKILATLANNLKGGEEAKEFLRYVNCSVFVKIKFCV